jgi:alkylhydroperoxidase family enzyme
MGDELSRQPELNAERDQTLLRAVVQVALQAPALVLDAQYDSLAGCPQLSGDRQSFGLHVHSERDK